MRVLQAPLCRRAWSSLLGQRGRGMGAPALGSGGRVLPRPLACGEEVEPEGTVPRQGLSGLRGSKDEVCNGGIALSSLTRLSPPAGLGGSAGGGITLLLVLPPAASSPQEEKQSPQHSMQISRQSADSQQASMMPQSMSQGRSQSAHSPELQQQQQMQESSEVQEPQVAQSSTMLQRVRNSQKRQERMQWTQQSAGEQGREVLTPQDGLGQHPVSRRSAPRGWKFTPGN